MDHRFGHPKAFPARDRMLRYETETIKVSILSRAVDPAQCASCPRTIERTRTHSQ